MKISYSILLVALFSVTQAVELTARDFAKYDEKLRSYQNLTGINESAFKEIWDAGISNLRAAERFTNSNAISRRDNSGPTMAWYGITTEEEGPLSPVIFDHEFFNHRMRYNNGIFIIDNPGYYRIEIKSYYNKQGVACRVEDSVCIAQYVTFNLKINSQHVLHQFSRWATAAPGSGIFYLDAFDTVFVGKGGNGKLSQGEIMNNIQIEKIY